jgi:undecaprenyl diphosphate synthase
VPKTKTISHLALIPDGNRRWAKAHHLPALQGHTRVVETVLPNLVTEVIALKIPYFTIWGFSTENWQRSQQEIVGLFQLLKLFLSHHGPKLHQDGVRLIFIGRRDNLEPDISQLIEYWSEVTENNQTLTLTIAFNYGGRDEIIRSVNRLLRQGDVSEVGESSFSQYLDTAIYHLPDPDLIIRTGGEKRLSGFMSWQAAYCELCFDDKLMPDWTAADLKRTLDDYYSRTRRFGK